jgi:hypothetical protein
MHKKIPLDQVAYWSIFLFAAISMTYVLVTLINLSSREETKFLPMAIHSSE